MASFCHFLWLWVASQVHIAKSNDDHNDTDIDNKTDTRTKEFAGSAFIVVNSPDIV